MTTPFDHDRNPERFRLATEVTQRYLRVGRSLYSHLAELLAGVGARRILDIGCGEGALRAALPVQLQSRAVGSGHRIVGGGAGPGVAHVGQLVGDHLGAVAAASPRLDGRAGFP